MIELLYAVSFVGLPFFMFYVINRLNNLESQIMQAKQDQRMDHKTYLGEVDALRKQISQHRPYRRPRIK